MRLVSLLIAWPLLLGAGELPGEGGPTGTLGGSRSGLFNPTPAGKGSGSVGFLTEVGGVAFGGVATPQGATSIAGLEYVASAPDGARLRVTLRTGGVDQQVVAAIPDWQMIPTARFAAGDQDAVFTLFGKLSTQAETDRIRAAGYEILGYHPAFHDTLLGLRLFHADVLILAPASADLPTVSGQYLLGLGESAPNVAANQRALNALVPYLIDGSGQQIFRSYLITDVGRPVTFSAANGSLVLDGYPLWYLWRFSVPDSQLDAQVDAANGDAYIAINQEYSRDALILTSAQLAAKYTDAYVQARYDELFDQSLSARILQPLPGPSDTLSEQIRLQGGVNPAVYSALTATMRYAAFFRAAKRTDLAGYAAFVHSFDCVRPDPGLVTPDIYRSGAELVLEPEVVPGPGGCPSWGVPGSVIQPGGGNPDAGTDGGGGRVDASSDGDASSSDTGGSTPDTGGSTQDTGGSSPDTGGSADTGGSTPDGSGRDATADMKGAAPDTGGSPDVGGSGQDSASVVEAGQVTEDGARPEGDASPASRDGGMDSVADASGSDGGTADAGAPAPKPGGGGGCGCSMPGAGDGTRGLLFAALVVGLSLAGRRRRPARRRRS